MSSGQPANPEGSQSGKSKTVLALLKSLRRGSGISVGLLFLVGGALASKYQYVLTGILFAELGSVLLAASLIHLTYERITREAYDDSMAGRLDDLLRKYHLDRLPADHDELLKKYRLDTLLDDHLAQLKLLLKEYRLDHVRSDVRSLLFDMWSDYKNLLSLGVDGGYSYFPTDEFVKRIENARIIKILKTWHPEEAVLENKIREAILRPNHPAQVHFFLCHPDSTILRQRCTGAGEENADEGKHKNERIVHQVYDWVRKKATASVTFYDAWPGAPVIQIDDFLFVGFFLRGTSSPNTPWLRIDPASPFGIRILQQFDFGNRDHKKVLDSQLKFEQWFRERKDRQQPPAKPTLPFREPTQDVRGGGQTP